MILIEEVTEAIVKEGFYIIDSFLDDQSFENLLKSIRLTYENGQFKPAQIGHKKNPNLSIRNDQIYWLDETTSDSALKPYFYAVDAIRNTLNRSLYLGLSEYEAHFAIYPPGTYYKKHIDQFAAAKERRISCVYYLNQEWKTEFGGELILYDQNNNPIIQIPPIGNRFICFSSEIPHEVNQTSQTRFSITGWLKTRQII